MVIQRAICLWLISDSLITSLSFHCLTLESFCLTLNIFYLDLITKCVQTGCNTTRRDTWDFWIIDPINALLMSSRWFHWKEKCAPPFSPSITRPYTWHTHGWFYSQKDKRSWNLLRITWEFFYESDKKNGWVIELSGSRSCCLNGGRRTATCKCSKV